MRMTLVLDKSEPTPNCVTVGIPPTYSEAGSIFESQVRSKTIGTWESCSWINDPKADEMIEDALGTFDTEERKAKYIAIQEYLADICPSSPPANSRKTARTRHPMWNGTRPPPRK